MSNVMGRHWSYHFCPTRGRIRIVYGNLSTVGGDNTSHAMNRLRGQWRNPMGWSRGGGVARAVAGTDRSVQTNPGPPSNRIAVPLAAIVKGISSTVLLGEKCLNRDQLIGPARPMTTWAGPAVGIATSTAGATSNPCPITAMRRKGNGTSRAMMTSITAPSVHRTKSSSNYAMCDGSVRPINYNISLHVFEYLCTRNVNLARSVGRSI